MKRVAEIAVFAGLAIALHIAAFIAAPQRGSDSQGAGGDARISLAGASAQTAAMVEDWEKPPELEPVTAPPLTPAITDAPPPVVTPEAPVAPQSLPQMIPQPTDVARVTVDTQPAEPPKRYAPTTSVRPQTRPAPRPQPPSTPQSTQRAAGTGGGAQAGQAATAAVSTASSGQQAALQGVWGATIRSRIERRKRFPRNARGSGEVLVVLTVSGQGALLSSSVQRSSGVDAFDQSALQAVARAAPFPAAPDGLTQSSYRFTLPIAFAR